MPRVNSLTGKAPVARAQVAKTPIATTPGGERLQRLWGMLAYLGHHNPVPLATLADEFGINQRQARADVKFLGDVETPGHTGFVMAELDWLALEEDNEVRLKLSGPMTIPMHFADDDVAPLIAALQALEASDFVGATADRVEVVRSTLAKLRQIAGPQADALDLQLPVVPNPAVAQIIAKAIQAGQRLSIEYVDNDDTVTRRDVDPVAVVTQDRHTYLRGWCYFRKAPRVFRLDRILKVVPLELPVDQAKVSEVAKDSDIARETASAATSTAVLTLAPAARWLAEELPGDYFNLPNGNIQVNVKVTSRSWLEGLLLGIAPMVLNIEPSELAFEVSNIAQAALKNY